MSSTNRNNADKRHIADYYVTPVQDIINFLVALDEEITLDLSNGNNIILDPCSGGDPEHPMSYPKAIKKHYILKSDGSNIKTIDIREDSLSDIKGDYLKTQLWYSPYVIITNPPFNQAMEFIKKALNDVREEGYVIMLLRLNFLETKSRKEFFDKYMPKYIFVHHKRMSFIQGGGTDSVAYCHMVWQKGKYPRFSKIRVI